MSRLPAEGPVTILFARVATAAPVPEEELRGCERELRERIAAHGGRAVKSLGDGVLAVFASPRRGVECGLSMPAAVAARGLKVRIGVHTGEATLAGGDVLGGAVNAAARICGRAAAGEVLVSDVVRQLCGHRVCPVFEERGRLTLRGFPGRWRLHRAGAPPTAPWRDGRSATAFVGREAERAELRTLLQRAADGRGGVAVLGGEAGVGKSRLCQAVIAEARERGFATHVGGCDETAHDRPYHPWVEMVETAARTLPRRRFLEGAGDDAGALARLAPGVRRLLPEVPAPEDVPDATRRDLTFDSLCDLLTRMAGRRPQLLVVEDLHWADQPTLLLLRHLAERTAAARVLIVGTYRHTGAALPAALTDTLATLIRRRQTTTLTLRPMGCAEVGSMLTALCGHAPPAAVSAAIHEQTDGNPLFVEEVVRHLAGSGGLLDAGGRFIETAQLDRLEVPDNVRQVTSRRLRRLATPTRRMLGAAAVLGRRFGYEPLAAVCDLDEDALLDAVDDAEHAGVIRADESSPSAFRFSHELLRQTLLSSLSSDRRRLLHARAAAALEQLCAGDLDGHAGEIARHLVRAGPGADPKRIARHLTTAGDRAREVTGDEEAVRHYRDALAILPDGELRQRAPLLVRLGEALRSLRRWDEQIDAWNRAVDALASLGDVEGLADLCFWFAYQHSVMSRYAEMTALLERGLAALPEGEVHRRARLRGMLGFGLSDMGRDAEALPHVREALRLARLDGDTALIGEVTAAEVKYHFTSMRLPESAAAGERAVAGLRDPASLLPLAQMLGMTASACAGMGRFDDCDALHAEVGPLLPRAGDWAVAAMVRRDRFVLSAARRGELDLLDGILDAGQPGSPAGGAAPLQRALLRHWRGDWRGACELVEAAARRSVPGWWSGIHQGFLLLLRAHLGERRAAVSLLAGLEDALPRPGAVSTYGAWQLAILAAESAALLGDGARARRLHPLVVEALRGGTVLRAYDARL
ncbi:MAG TPA: BREX system ATP-binding domain-containing protein, partial [Candidatus Dormibacteraeota bacterium]|nr:BREX system ATP-binding domain-containing protein [Candidatus Dormibacteraeota bacterium]